MAKQSVTQRLIKSLTRKINRLNRQGVSTGTLKEDIRHMNWRQLKKLATPSKTGRSTFKGLKKYLAEEPRREYDRRTGRQSQDESEPIPEVDVGYNYSYTVLEMLMSFFNESVSDTREGRGGRTIQRNPTDISESQRAQNFLMDLFYSTANDIGFSALGERLQPHAQEISEDIGRCLYGYAEEVRAGMIRISEYINGAELTSEQWDRYSDFADSLMGDDIGV